MGVQATKYADTHDAYQNIVFKTTSGSFHNLNSPRDIHKDFIWKKWKFTNHHQSQQMMSKLKSKLTNPHPHITSVKDIEYTKTNKQIYKIRAKIEFSQRSLKNQIQNKKLFYKYFSANEIWSAINQICQIATYAHQNNIQISQNLSSYLLYGNIIKMKDPELIPEIKAQKHNNNPSSKIICRLISNLALLTNQQKIVNFVQINRINLYYNVYLATFVFFLREEQLTIQQIRNLSKKLQQQNSSEPQYKTPTFKLPKDKTITIVKEQKLAQQLTTKPDKKQGESKLNPISSKLMKKSISQEALIKKFAKRIQQIKPKDLKQINKSIKYTYSTQKQKIAPQNNQQSHNNKQNIQQNNENNKQNNLTLNNTEPKNIKSVEILQQDHYFPKKNKQFLRTSSTDTDGNSSRNIDMRSSQARNQAFMKITGGSRCELFGQCQSQQLLQSIIQSEESIIIQNNESPLFSIQQQMDLITQDFLKLQNALSSSQKDEAQSIIQFGYQRNETIMQVTEENESSDRVQRVQCLQDAKSSIFRYNESNISQFQLQAQKQEQKFVIQQYEGGSRYEGYILNGLRNGFGKLYYEDGGSYQGSWKNGEIQGYGKLYYQSGDLAYEGYWYRGQFHGEGKIINQNPDQIEGEFNYRDFTDIGISWIEYEGNFEQDHKNGRGTLLLSNGQKFSGHWNRNNVQGEGEFLTLKNKLIRGIWKNNLLIEIQEQNQAQDQCLYFTND